MKRTVVYANEINGSQLDLQGLPSGIFLLNLSINDRVRTRTRLVKL